MPELRCKFSFGDRVTVDGCDSIVGVVTCIEWRKPDVVRYEVSWITSGDAKFTVFDEWRLTRAH